MGVLDERRSGKMVSKAGIFILTFSAMGQKVLFAYRKHLSPSHPRTHSTSFLRCSIVNLTALTTQCGLRLDRSVKQVQSKWFFFRGYVLHSATSF
jgi:hypothetical protein